MRGDTRCSSAVDPGSRDDVIDPRSSASGASLACSGLSARGDRVGASTHAAHIILPTSAPSGLPDGNPRHNDQRPNIATSSDAAVDLSRSWAATSSARSSDLSDGKAYRSLRDATHDQRMLQRNHRALHKSPWPGSIASPSADSKDRDVCGVRLVGRPRTVGRSPSQSGSSSASTSPSGRELHEMDDMSPSQSPWASPRRQCLTVPGGRPAGEGTAHIMLESG